MNKNTGHANSYYAATAHDRRVRETLTGSLETQICVIGAGFTGISAALELAERGFKVVVLEAHRIGFGASGRNGGQIVNGYSRDLATIAKRYGEEKAQILGRMSLEGGQIIRERVKKYQIDCDLTAGGFFAAFTQKQFNAMQSNRENWQKYGHDGLEMVARADMDRYVANNVYYGGMADHHGGHVHPLNLVLGEAASLERQGGKIFENSRAIIIEKGEKPCVHTEKGKVHADYLLICANAYLGDLLPEISSRMMPVSSQVMASEPLGADYMARLMPANYCVEDANYVLDYYRRSGDHRLIFGGGIGYGGQDPKNIEAKLRPHLLKTFPQLAGVRIEFAWSGNFALTLTRVPHMGRLSPRIYFSHGDSGHGVTTTHLLGKILGEMVAGHAGRFDVWASLPNLPFPGGRLLRVPLTVLGAWWYGIRDKLGY